MTTIVYKDGILAGDTQISSGNCLKELVETKVFKVRDYLVGIAGTYAYTKDLLNWVISDFAPDKRPQLLYDNDTINAIVVKDTGEVGVIEGFRDVCWLSKKNKFTVIGAGGDIAIGAMEMGATAVEAIKIVSKHNSSTNSKVTSVCFDWAKKSQTKAVSEAKKTKTETTSQL